jgi:hypothetical protein|tara:strand:+ start:176 stop:613 length:438 start_codon:yes stop_codon:yes gene_type:complete
MSQTHYALGDPIGPLEYTISDKAVIDFISINESPEKMVRFSSSAQAISKKFPACIVPGNMHLILLTEFLTKSIENISIEKIDMIFRHVVKQNIQLIIKGFIINIFYADNIKHYECDITMKNSEGIVLIIANAKFIFKNNLTIPIC